MSFIGTLLNGDLKSHQSLSITIAGAPYQSIIELDYSLALEYGELRGQSSTPRGTTRGVENVTASMSMYRDDGDILLGQLALLSGVGAYARARFGMSVSFFELSVPPSIISVDRFIGTRIMNVQQTSSDGAQEPTKLQFQLHVQQLLINQLPALGGVGSVAGAVAGI